METIFRKIRWKLYFGKFDGNYILENSMETIFRKIRWKLYFGKFDGNYISENLMETIRFSI